MFPPTYANMAGFIHDKLHKAFKHHPQLVDDTLMAEYSQQYAKFFEQGRAEGQELTDKRARKDFAANLSNSMKQQFQARAEIHDRIGANEAFTGDGLTKYTGPGDRRYGAVEMFVYEPQPQPISQHLRSGQLVCLEKELQPLKRK